MIMLKLCNPNEWRFDMQLKCIGLHLNMFECRQTHADRQESGGTWDLMLSQLIVLVGLLHGPDGAVVDLPQPLQCSWRRKTQE